MKKLESLYRLAERRGIEVIYLPLPETLSMSVEPEENTCYIGMDSSLSTASAQERTHLAHELGHCVTGSFYNRYTAHDLRQRHENRADKWAVRRLIPKADLDEAIAAGYTELWELADFFGVTEDFVKKAICLYTYGNLAVNLYF